jgi:hypothetical protein
MYVYDRGGHIAGLLRVERESSRDEWTVVELDAVGDMDAGDVRFRLVQHLLRDGQKRGAVRFHVACADADDNVELFMQAGFARYGEERVLYRPPEPALPEPWTEKAATAARIRHVRPVDANALMQLYATITPLFKTVSDGAAYPRLVPKRGRFTVSNIFTDFKRHDVGPSFYERNYDGTLHTEFMTAPLWGIGSKSPYGHDGRSVSLEDVILRHGGEAAAARSTFVSLDEDNKRKIIEFLDTLLLFPPDDTASNLNPGNPATTDPQDPAQHGSIALSSLFQLPMEGGE